MKQLTGTVETIQSLPTDTVKAIMPPVPEIKTQSLVNILQSIKKEDGTPIVNYNESLALTSLKFQRGDHILTLEDRYFVYEIVNMLNTLDYVVVYNFLATNWESIFGSGPNLRKKILFENPLLSKSRDRLELDMEIFRSRVEVSKGAVDCKRCGSEETLSVERMTRSADEPMTIRVTCLQCKYKWTAQ